MAKGTEKQRKAQAPDKENDAPVSAIAPALRPSKFKEGTMNSTTSIHAPPDELWKDLDLDQLIDRFNEEANAPAASSAAGITRTHDNPTSMSTQPTSVMPGPVIGATPTVAPATEGTLGRFSRAVASFWSNAGASFSSLGKRKAGNESAELRATEKGAEHGGEDRKREVEAAYQQAKELGLLPKPKVFVRPVSRARKASTAAAHANLDTPTPVTTNNLAPPKTPSLYKSPSKKDLNKQKKLSKRVSNLEHKLAEARRELTLALNAEVPAVPSLPSNLPSPPNSTHNFASESERSPPSRSEPPPAEPPVVELPPVEPPSTGSSSKTGKIVKKRKAVTDDSAAYKPVPTDSDMSLDSEREIKRSRTASSSSKKLKRKNSRLLKKQKASVTTTKEEVVTVIPDGVSVPPIPSIPKGVSGRRVTVRDDGYGGLEHEMF